MVKLWKEETFGSVIIIELLNGQFGEKCNGFINNLLKI